MVRGTMSCGSILFQPCLSRNVIHSPATDKNSEGHASLGASDDAPYPNFADMSSTRRSSGSAVRGGQRASSDTQWSAWEWNEQYQCESRYRQDRNGEWKWEYRQVVIEGNEPDPPPPNESTPRDSSTNLWTLPEESLQEVTQEPAQEDAPGNFTTDPDPGVDSITQSLSKTYVTDNRPNSQSFSSYSNAFSSTSTYGSSSKSNWERNRIRTRDTGSGYEKNDKRFKVHKSNQFTFGRVFKVLWSEPTGAGGTEITERGGGGKTTFQKQRRFVIVNTRKGHSICLPIMTYGGQGTLKYGVHPEDHAAIYTKHDGPVILEGEHMENVPIRVDVIDQSHKLDPMSRLNYAKLYTVEHNVKVFFIGKIAKNYEQKVVDAYNYTNQPLPDRPQAETTEDTFQYAEGLDPNYPQAMGPSSSWTGHEEQDPNYSQEMGPSSSSWTEEPNTEPLPDEYDDSQDQYPPAWAGQSNTDAPAPDHGESHDGYEAPPNIYDKEE